MSLLSTLTDLKTLDAGKSAKNRQSKRYRSWLTRIGSFLTYLNKNVVGSQRPSSYEVLNGGKFPTKMPEIRSRQLSYLGVGNFLFLCFLHFLASASTSIAQNTPSATYQFRVEALETAIKKGDVAAMFELGKIFSMIEGDYEKAHILMLQAGERGHIDAMLEIAEYYRLKKITPSDALDEDYWRKKAVDVVQLLAELGNAREQRRLGDFFRHGFYTLPENLELAIYWHEAAANQGDRDAMASLGSIYKSTASESFQDDDLATYWELASMGLKLQPDLEQEMTFGEYCDGKNIENCYIFGEGIITDKTVNDFRTLVMGESLAGGYEARTIILNSIGGNLGAGIELGQLIRKIGVSTRIGDPRTLFSFMQNYKTKTPAECSSACAYAFLGGVQRFLSERDKLGFHQFFREGGGDIEMGAAQELSGQIVKYIVDMGVDARIFTLASSQGASGLKYIDEATAESSGIITPSGYGAFFLEPYGEGVIAAAKRLDPGGPSDVVFQVTAFCKAGDPYLLFSSNATPDRTADFVLNSGGNEYRISENDVSVSRAKLNETAFDIGLIEVRLSTDVARILETSEFASTYFEFTRAEGGFFGSYLYLSDLDRRMLQLAFRVCI